MKKAQIDPKLYAVIIGVIALVILLPILSSFFSQLSKDLTCKDCNEALTNCRANYENSVRTNENLKSDISLLRDEFNKTILSKDQLITSLTNKNGDLINILNNLNNSLKECVNNLGICQDNLSSCLNKNHSILYSECQNDLDDYNNNLTTCNLRKTTDKLNVNLIFFNIPLFYVIFITFIIIVCHLAYKWISDKDPINAVMDGLTKGISIFIIAYLSGVSLCQYLNLNSCEFIGSVTGLLLLIIYLLTISKDNKK